MLAELQILRHPERQNIYRSTVTNIFFILNYEHTVYFSDKLYF